MTPLTFETFPAIRAQRGLTLIDFGAQWCAPCRLYSPTFAAMAARFLGVRFAAVDVDDESALADQFDVRSLPTTIALRDGVFAGRLVGAVSGPTLERLVNGFVTTGAFNQGVDGTQQQEGGWR